MAGWLDPAAVFAEASMCADGANDAVGGGGNAFSLLHEEFEAAAGAGGALAVETEGARVAVDDAAVGELEVVGDGGGALPVEECLVDGVAFRVAADGAAGCVVVEVYRGFLFLFRGMRWAVDPDQVFLRLRREGLGCGQRGFSEARRFGFVDGLCDDLRSGFLHSGVFSAVA